jgi:hypothetical protein
MGASSWNQPDPRICFHRNRNAEPEQGSVHSVAYRPGRFNFWLHSSLFARLSLASRWQFARSSLFLARRWLAFLRSLPPLLPSPDVQTRQAGNAWPMDRPHPSRHRRAASCLVDVPGVRVVVGFKSGSARVEFRAGRRGLHRLRDAPYAIWRSSARSSSSRSDSCASFFGGV